MTTTETAPTSAEAGAPQPVEPGRVRASLSTWLRSARTRLAIAVLVLLALASLASVIALRQILISRTGERVDEALEQEVREFRRLTELGQDPRTGRPFGNDIEAMFEVFLSRNIPVVGEEFFTFIDGQAFRSSSDRPADDPLVQQVLTVGGVTDTTRGEFESEGEEFRYVAVPVQVSGPSDGTFAVAINLGDEREEVNEAVQIAAGVSVVVFLFAALIVFATVGRVLAPVRALTDTARTISESDLTRRIEVEGDDELARLGRTFNGMLDRLETAFGSQKRFLADAGHELRTPITIVRGHLELMGDDPGERRATVALVDDELDRMGRLVDELLTLERAQRPDFLRVESLDLETLMEETLAKASAIATRHWQLAGARAGDVVGDRQRLQQALLNLAQNAVKHTSEEDAVELGAELSAGAARLWVRDTGDGIAPDAQKRVFDRFWRGERSGREGGTGLGLALVKAIAEAHDGHVEVVSEPGAGSRFTLVIPARRRGGGR